jgi:NAD(P)-dependent dehydrogenase (short-subunit alcohol dehydrogenase family)
MDKVWFITGAGRGMGVDIARAALAAGHAVVATASAGIRAKPASRRGRRRCRCHRLARSHAAAR